MSIFDPLRGEGLRGEDLRIFQSLQQYQPFPYEITRNEPIETQKYTLASVYFESDTTQLTFTYRLKPVRMSHEVRETDRLNFLVYRGRIRLPYRPPELPNESSTSIRQLFSNGITSIRRRIRETPGDEIAFQGFHRLGKLSNNISPGALATTLRVTSVVGIGLTSLFRLYRLVQEEY